jgi:hypothetical protein
VAVIGALLAGSQAEAGRAGLPAGAGRRDAEPALCPPAHQGPGPLFPRCAWGSGRLGAGAAVVPGDGYCLALGERRAGGECLVELARVQALADLCYQFGLYLP